MFTFSNGLRIRAARRLARIKARVLSVQLISNAPSGSTPSGKRAHVLGVSRDRQPVALRERGDHVDLPPMHFLRMHTGWPRCETK